MKTFLKRKYLPVLMTLAILLAGLPALMLLPPLTAEAAEASQLVTTINSFAHGGAGTLSASAAGNTVTVTGTVTGATNELTLNIDADVTVQWKAAYSGAATNPASLISLPGDGTFEVITGGSLANSGTGHTVYAPGANAAVKVSGGTVSTTTGRAVFAFGTSATVTVSGSGKVEATGDGGYAVDADGNVNITGGTVSATTRYAVRTYGTSSTVTVSGGTVNATSGSAIYTSGTNATITISGGTVSATTQYTVWADGINSAVEISGGTVSATTGRAVFTFDTDSTITVSGGAVSATTGRAVFTYGSVNITGGTVSATTGYAVCAYNTTSTVVTVSGGFVFAWGNDISDVVDNASFTAPTGNGIVAAWNTATGTGTYVEGATTALTVFPSGSAAWHDNAGAGGVSYAKNANTGFFPLAGVTVNSASIALDVSGTHTLPGAAYGYGTQTAKAVAVTNTGNAPTGTLAAALSGTNSGSFTLSAASIGSIAVGGTGNFTVRPNTGLSAGTHTATVTVSGGNGIVSRSFTVRFTVSKAHGATVAAPTLAGKTVSSITINAVAAPLSGQTVQYAVSKKNIAPTTGWRSGLTFSGLSLNTQYYVFARSAGNANYNAGTASSSLAVSTADVTVTLNATKFNLLRGQKTTLKATVLPTNLPNKRVVWSSSNPTAATVDQTGKVTAKLSGTAVITAASNGKKATCTVTVHAYVIMRVGYKKAIADGKKTTISGGTVTPVIIKGRTMLPLRFVEENMGAKVKYVSDKDPITVTYGGRVVSYRLGSKQIKVTEGKTTRIIQIDVAPQKRNGRTLVPVRATSEALGYHVYYRARDRMIVVNNPHMTKAVRDARLKEGAAYIK